MRGSKLLERAGGGVAGIGKDFLARRRALGVEFLESVARHIDFAPHFQHVRAGPWRESRKRHRADRLQIGGDVVADAFRRRASRRR